MIEAWEGAAALVRDGTAVAALVDAAIKAAIVLAFAAVLTRALRRSSASLRHLVWGLAIGAALLLPFLTAATPRWGVPGLPRIEPAATPTLEAEPVEPKPAAPASEDGAVAPPESKEKKHQPNSSVKFASRSNGEDQDLANGAAIVRREEPARAGMTWPVLAMLVWAGGALMVLAGIAVGWAKTWRIGRNAKRLTNGPLARMADELSAQLGLTRRVTLLQCSGACMPMTWGVIRPKVLLPRDVLEWPTERLRAVLLHELAHVKRFDFLTQLLARINCGLYWFNPLVWLAADRLRAERELACDDQVLRTGSRASDYAEHLLEVARSVKAGTMSSTAAVAMARPSQLGVRLVAALDAGRARAALSRRVVASAWLSAALVVLPVAGAAPQSDSPSFPEEQPSHPEADGNGVSAWLEGAVPMLASPPTLLTETAVDTEASAEGELATLELSSLAFPQALDCDWTARGGKSSTSIHSDDDKLRVKMSRDNCELEIDLEGVLSFDEAYTTVSDLSRGGKLEIQEERGRESRRLVLEGERGGSLSRTWYVNRDERPYDAEAEAWLSDMLLVLFRRAGYKSTQRAEYILARDGAEGLLQEISHIPSDYAARRYYTVLLSQADLDPETVGLIVRQVGEDIESDHELSQLLIAIAEKHPLDEAVRIAYVEAANSIESDHAHANVLSAILKRRDLSPALAQSMLESATSIDSDYELARLLIELIESRPLDDATARTFFQAVATIDSDHSKRQVLDAAIKQRGTDERFLDQVLEAAQDISSDHELGRLLGEVSALYPSGQSIPNSYFAAASSIDSDFELGRVLTSLVKRGDLNASSQVSVLEAAAEIDSDHELGKLLNAVISEYGVDDTTRPTFFRAVDSLSSDFEHARVLGSVLKVMPLARATVEAVLESALEIDSDHELGRVLTQVANSHPIDDDLRPAFMKAVDSIGSTYERDRVLAAAYRSGA
jgi:beta-lactamase regulating signal transducer with metallopeptidase domain